MRIISRLAAAALVVAGVVTTPQAHMELQELFDEVEDSIVIIRVSQPADAAELAQGLTDSEGMGSGVVVSLDGKVMTAAHVVQTADAIVVEFADGAQIPARVLASEPAADVALLQLASLPHEIRVAKLGDSDEVKVGHQVFVVGAPYGLNRTLTVGYISGRHQGRTLYGGLALGEYFQTDAAINQGNSGGPLFNLEGEVVGIVSHILSQSGGFEGIGFAATSNLARQLLLEEEWVWTGLDAYVVHGELARILNVPPPGMAMLVQRIAENSPAARLGLQAGSIVTEFESTQFVIGGDMILEVQGIPMQNQASYLQIRESVRKLRPGDDIEIKVLRGGEIVELHHAFGGRRDAPTTRGSTGD